MKGTSVDKRKNENILDRVILVVQRNDSLSIVNVDKIARSIH